MVKVLLSLGFFFVSFQTIYNISPSEQFWGKHFFLSRNVLEKIGFYQYKYMNTEKLGPLKPGSINFQILEFKRSYGIILDLLSYYLLIMISLLLYFKDLQTGKEIESLRRREHLNEDEEDVERLNPSSEKLKKDAEIPVTEVFPGKHRHGKDVKFDFYKALIRWIMLIWVQHSFKLCVVLTLCSSILVKIDLIHLMYLLMFMVLMGLDNNNKRKQSAFNFIILYSGFIILALYLYQVLQIKFSNDFENLVGLITSNSNLVYLYKEHVLVFFTYLISFQKGNEI
jgi:hypothetical protein